MIDNQPSDDLSPLSPIKRAFLAIEELQAKLRATERAQHAPIAIIGMACRFPGGANSPAVFWQQLLAGFDAMQPVPADRWNNAEVYAPTAEPGKVYTNQAAFIDNIRGFDAQFFGISPREAAAIDPQQRILLELAWEALEDAGVIPANLVGSSTGVFIGSMTYDYLQLQLSTHDLAYLNPQIVTGSGLSFAAGRISYLLGLQGPSLVVDTACSSSLLSTHLAVQSLRSGECNLALAGGVNAILTPQMSVMMSQLGALSADSHCKTFDADADGYARGEGCGILILKRLDQALADNDHIYAVIQGTATNHDGASAGLTVPNGPAQQTLMRKALADAALAPEAIQYIEAHGTGTSLGDPIELGAIAAVYAKHRTADTPLLVGSVKTNIGHLEGAAGISGLIKLILALYHGKIPSHRHFTNPNPYIDWDQIAVRVQTSTTEWSSEPAQPRVGAVSSFGLSGTNVHMIVAAAEPVATPVATHATSPTVILLSAHTHAALHARWTTWQHWLPTQAPAALPAIAATAAFQRTHFSVRTALVIDQPDQVAAALAAPPVLATVHPAPRVAFVFAGQAPLDPERFAALAAHPVTAPILAQGFALLQQAGLDLPALLALPDAAQHLRHTQIAQPALLLMQVALTALWRTLGIQPAAVLGHSVGELAAAVAAGVLAFPAALALAIARGTLLAPLHDQGAMLVVGAAAATVAADLAQHPARAALSIAAVNAPTLTVVAGTPAAIQAFAASQTALGRYTRDVGVAYAFHSAQVEPFLPAWQQHLAGMQGAVEQCPIYSSVTGQAIAGTALDGAYWTQHVRAPVQFAAAVSALLADGITAVIELGAGSTLQGALQQISAAANPATVVVPSLARDHRLIASLARAAGQLWAHGVALEWSSLIPPTTTPYPLPAYPWQHEDYWIEPSREISSQRASQTTSQPTLLGKKLQLPLKEQIYEQILDPEQMAFANAIRLYETPIVAYGLLTELLCQINTTLNLLSLSQISFKPQPLTSYQSRTVHGIICGSDQAQIELSAIGLLKAEDWQPLVSAQATTARISALAINIHQLCPNPEDLSSMFQQLSTIGWHGLEQTLPILEVWSGSGRLLIRLNSTELAKDWLGFAKALETLWQFGALVSQQQANTTPKVPNTIQQLTWQSNRDTPAWLYITVSDQNPLNVDAWLLDTHQQPILEAREISYNTLAYSDFIAQQHGSEWLYALEWHELSAPIAQATPNPLGFWIILPDAQGIAEHLATALKKIGWAIVWLKADDPNQLVTELASIQQAGSCQGVIDCRIIDLPALTAEIDQHVTEIAECCLQTIGLVQALVSVPAYAQSRIWLVTRGAQDVNSRHPVALEESALWGLGRAIALEHPAIWNGLIDLDPNQDFVADQLIADLHYSGSIREIAFRNGRRYESRLVQTPNAATDLAMPIREHASYLITGGLGGIGLETARRLAAEGAQSIILVGRRTPQASSQRIIDQLRATGTQITTIAADITNQTDIQQLFDQIDQTLPPLRGILHLAAQTSDAMLSEQTLAHFVQVLKPKLAGGWLLHQQTRDRDLDFLILFSSAAALFGAIGRSNYAAANAFLDGLASFRRSQGLPGLSLNWGAWAEVGMAAEALSTTQQTAMGAIKPLQGLNILANLRSKHQQLAIFPIQWQAFSALFPANRQPTLLSLCIDQNHSTIEADHALMRRLVAATQPERQELLIDLILTTARATLGFTTAIPIDKKVPLNQYGLDSILALDLRKRIQTSLGLDLPATLLFDYPTPELLADHLNTLISLPIAQPEITAEPEVDQLDLIEQLSDDEVDALFARILEQEGSND